MNWNAHIQYIHIHMYCAGDLGVNAVCELCVTRPEREKQMRRGSKTKCVWQKGRGSDRRRQEDAAVSILLIHSVCWMCVCGSVRMCEWGVCRWVKGQTLSHTFLLYINVYTVILSSYPILLSPSSLLSSLLFMTLTPSLLSSTLILIYTVLSFVTAFITITHHFAPPPLHFLNIFSVHL